MNTNDNDTGFLKEDKEDIAMELAAASRVWEAAFARRAQGFKLAECSLSTSEQQCSDRQCKECPQCVAERAARTRRLYKEAHAEIERTKALGARMKKVVNNV